MKITTLLGIALIVSWFIILATAGALGYQFDRVDRLKAELRLLNIELGMEKRYAQNMRELLEFELNRRAERPKN